LVFYYLQQFFPSLFLLLLYSYLFSFLRWGTIRTIKRPLRSKSCRRCSISVASIDRRQSMLGENARVECYCRILDFLEC
jgi:hypothetical protein